MIGGSKRYRSTGNLPSSNPRGTPIPTARANPMANSDRLTETSWRKSPLGTISRMAANTGLGWLVKVGSTMPARGAISQIARNTSTAIVETNTRYFDEGIGIFHLPSSEDILKLDESWGNSRELRGLREWAHQGIL